MSLTKNGKLRITSKFSTWKKYN